MGIIERAALEMDEKTNRPRKLRITLLDMIIEAIKERKNVLTLHRDYFRLRKPIQRRIYELARKHCGNQEEWCPYVKTLHVKSGSKAELREFRRAFKNLVEEKSLPDYDIALDEENDQVIFTNKKNALTGQEKEGDGFPALEPETYNDARIVASGYDVYYLEEEWRDWWVDSGKPPLSNPDKAFIGFCKAGYEKNPNP